MNYPAAHRPLFIWLLISAGMVFAMAIIGAITRLTESGLSITEWAPIKGALPPLSDHDWQKAFDDYRQIPQYQILNKGMSLEEFKTIYFWEWIHRLWGRLIGLVYALPFFFFLITKKIPVALQGRLWLILLLGGLQGFIGWFMVQSGLSERTSVSPYRLAMHLSLALIIYSFLIWTIADIRRQSTAIICGASFCLKRHNVVTLFFLALTIIWGAFVAGLDAGHAYNTFPLMAGHYMPPEVWTLSPVWLNFFENTAMVQFIHRNLAYITFFLAVSLAFRLWHVRGPLQRYGHLVGATALLQLLLGIGTVISGVDITLATLHQGGAILLLTTLLLSFHRMIQKEPAVG
jgi:heme a synthase